jgi:hypothetical protein
MTHIQFPWLASLLVLALANGTSAGEEAPAPGRDQPAATRPRRTRPKPAPSQAAKRLASYEAHSLVRLPYRRGFLPKEAAQDATAASDSRDDPVETIVYGGSAAPYLMAALSEGGRGGNGDPWGRVAYNYTFPYAYGRLASPYSYGVYGYPYYSFYRPSFAYSVWGWPGISPLGNFGYGGYGLPYGYYGLGGYNRPYGFGGYGFPYGGARGIGYPYGYGGYRRTNRRIYLY